MELRKCLISLLTIFFEWANYTFVYVRTLIKLHDFAECLAVCTYGSFKLELMSINGCTRRKCYFQQQTNSIDSIFQLWSKSYCNFSRILSLRTFTCIEVTRWAWEFSVTILLQSNSLRSGGFWIWKLFTLHFYYYFFSFRNLTKTWLRRPTTAWIKQQSSGAAAESNYLESMIL